MSWGVIGFVQAKYLVEFNPDPDTVAIVEIIPNPDMGAMSPVDESDVAIEMSDIAPVHDLNTHASSSALQLQIADLQPRLPNVRLSGADPVAFLQTLEGISRDFVSLF